MSLPLHSHSVGSFPFHDLPEFFGNYEIVIEYKILSGEGKILLHCLIPYQAIFIASGEAFT